MMTLKSSHQTGPHPCTIESNYCLTDKDETEELENSSSANRETTSSEAQQVDIDIEQRTLVPSR